MSSIISGFGTQITLVCSVSFPLGLNISEWADDADPIDSPSVQIGDAAMANDGVLLGWSKGVPIPLVLSVRPTGEDDKNLTILADNNRVAQGRKPVNDEIIATIVYPSGNTVTLIRGKILDAIMVDPFSSAGRIKTKTYGFKFQDVLGRTYT
jgi:hypothetical protein